MTMTLHDTTPDGVPSWLAIGVRALDTSGGRIGIVQLLQDDLGTVRTGAIQRPTRALLRPVGQRQPLWWVHIANLERPPGSAR